MRPKNAEIRARGILVALVYCRRVLILLSEVKFFTTVIERLPHIVRDACESTCGRAVSMEIQSGEG